MTGLGRCALQAEGLPSSLRSLCLFLCALCVKSFFLLFVCKLSTVSCQPWVFSFPFSKTCMKYIRGPNSKATRATGGQTSSGSDFVVKSLDPFGTAVHLKSGHDLRESPCPQQEQK
jgi:hypothetical protein